MLLGFAFISQAATYTMMPYHMISMEVMNHQELSHMDHSSHAMMSHSMSEKLMLDEPIQNCCEQNCKCLTSGYSTLVLLSKIMTNSLAIEPSSKIPSIVNQAQSTIPTSPYKPPILS